MRGRDEEVNSETGTCCDCGSKQKPLVNGVKGIVHPKFEKFHPFATHRYAEGGPGAIFFVIFLAALEFHGRERIPSCAVISLWWPWTGNKTQ